MINKNVIEVVCQMCFRVYLIHPNKFNSFDTRCPDCYSNYRKTINENKQKIILDK